MIAQAAKLLEAASQLARTEAVHVPGTAAPARRPPPRWDPKWKNERKVCPHCGRSKVVDPDFGVRVVRGVERPQPWCRACRSGTNYHNRPRKNRSVNNP
jgi:hypothetical protein